MWLEVEAVNEDPLPRQTVAELEGPTDTAEGGTFTLMVLDTEQPDDV
jgi:hypothetical protein